jgi:4,5-DOPA dioxygenase extradiol
MARPRTIHDFFGFPEELFAFEYPADGDPELAEETIDLLRPTWCGADHDTWGLDHGTWSVLAHMFPSADVPVVQLSIDATKSPADHVALGAALAPLRDRGVLIVGSGNVVHHLGMLDPSRPESGFEWAHAYDEAAREIMETRPSDIDELFQHDHHQRAAPTPEHLLPLFYIAGAAAASGTAASARNVGCALGSLSMTCYVVD